MTAATMFLGLVPIMWSTGAGSDVMKRIAAPMIGGILTSFVLELVVYPALYEVWRSGGRMFRADQQIDLRATDALYTQS
jgi:Cu/Ag efflux pump CusA